jgi:predicted kinase
MAAQAADSAGCQSADSTGSRSADSAGPHEAGRAGPRAVLVGGAPGTGKSTLAAALAPRLGAALIDLDVATGPLTAVVAGLAGATDLSDPRIAGLTRTPRYETLFALAEDNLRVGTPAVLVAPFTAERTADGWRTVVQRLAAPVLIWLHLPDAELVKRLTSRGAVRDREKTADPWAYLAGIDRDPPSAPHLALDAMRPVAELVERVLAHLATG